MDIAKKTDELFFVCLLIWGLGWFLYPHGGLCSNPPVVPQNELSQNNFCSIYSDLAGSLKAFAKIGSAAEAIWKW